VEVEVGYIGGGEGSRGSGWKVGGRMRREERGRVIGGGGVVGEEA